MNPNAAPHRVQEKTKPNFRKNYLIDGKVCIPADFAHLPIYVCYGDVDIFSGPVAITLRRLINEPEGITVTRQIYECIKILDEANLFVDIIPEPLPNGRAIAVAKLSGKTKIRRVELSPVGPDYRFEREAH